MKQQRLSPLNTSLRSILRARHVFGSVVNLCGCASSEDRVSDTEAFYAGPAAMIGCCGPPAVVRMCVHHGTSHAQRRERSR